MTAAGGPAHAVEIDGLRVVCGGTVVLDGLSLALRTSAVIGRLGPSGCGKTTLLRAIVGVQIVEGRVVTVLGLPAGEPGLRHRLAYATQAARPPVAARARLRLQPGRFDRIGPALLALFPFVVMFLVTSVTTLRERTSGTFERLLSMPLGRLDLLFGYGLAFALVAVVQAVLASTLMVWVLDLDLAGPAWLLVVVAVADAILGCALGLFVSAFARTEFQAVQFMPAVVLPQLLLCGLLVPRDELGGVLEAISWVLPLSYAVHAMNRLVTEAGVSGRMLADLAVLLGAIVASLTLCASTLRRRTA